MNRCKKCGQLSGNYVLCDKCANENENENSQQNNLDQKQNQVLLNQDYHYNMIKGRIAETLIEELFLSQDWGVFRYGMENTIPGVMKLLKGVKNEVANDIRRMPDFVMQDKNRDLYYVEVKFRARGEFSIDEFYANYPYENAYFVVVSKSQIKCITYKELKNGEKITPGLNHCIEDRKEFNLDKEKVQAFQSYAEIFFGNV